MADTSFASNRWIYGGAYIGVMTAIMLVHILPVRIGPQNLPGPDLMIAVTFAWVLRRPQYIPTLLVALVFLVADMLFLRPPGLWTALVVLAVEFLRAREASAREQAFPLEFALIAGTVLAITLVYRLILTMFLVVQAGFGLSLLQVATTLLSYPLIVLLSRSLFGVAKMTPGETDARGRPR